MVETAPSRADVRERIVETAAALLQQHGPTAVTTRAVADAAGVQPPTIYRLFGDKDGLLEAVAEHVIAVYVAAKSAVVAAAVAADVDPLADLRDGWRAQIEFSLANPSLFALLNDPGRAAQSAAARSGRELLAARVHRLAVAGRLRVTEPRAVDLIQAAGIGAIQVLLAREPHERDTSLTDTMFESVLHTMLVDAPVPRGAADAGAEVRAAVAFRAVAPDFAGLTEAERGLLTEWLDRALQAREAAT